MNIESSDEKASIKTDNTRQPKQDKSLLVFFLSCFQISAFTFGGGYVIVPLQKRRFSEELAWIDEERILDLVAMAQSAPGPIAVNASTLMGYHLFGLKGALLGALATVLPPLLILSIISLFYETFAANPLVRAVLGGMKAAVAALIVYTVVTMSINVFKSRSPFLLGLLFLSLFLALFTQLNVFFIILIVTAITLVAYVFKNLNKKKC